jgi:hypothetical protein
MSLKGIGWIGVDWIHLAQDRIWVTNLQPVCRMRLARLYYAARGRIYNYVYIQKLYDNLGC